MKCFVFVLFCGAYVFASEVYPTSIRTTGSACAVGFGRLGAMVSPLVYESVTEATGNHATFFGILFLAAVINACIIDFTPFEPSTQHGGHRGKTDDLSAGSASDY